MKFTMRKNRLNIVYASDIIQQERLPVKFESWWNILLIIRPIYAKTFVANKLSIIQNIH